MSENRYIGLEDLEEINKQRELEQKNRKKYRNKKERKSIFERFSTKENIIIFSFLLIFLIIGWRLIVKFNPFSDINYRKVDINSFLENSSVENNRDVYWILNEVLLEFLYSNGVTKTSNNGESAESNSYYKYDTQAYYNVLTSDYKTYLTKKKYLELANSVINNYQENYESLVNATNEAPIRKIYKYNKLAGDYYIVRLSTSNESYIGIELMQDTSNYKIFFLELKEGD